MMRRALLAAVSAVFLTPSVLGQTKTDLSASDILERMAQAYRTCASYRDTGTVTTVFHDAKLRGMRDVKPFSTAFVRPDRFRFEFTETMVGMTSRFVIWQQGKEARSWWTVEPKVSTSPDVDLPIAGATGVSGGSAHTVPRLLMPAVVTGWALSDIEAPTLAGAETIDGAACYKIGGRDSQGGAMVVWIDKSSYLLRKLSEHLATASADTTTTYHPQVGVRIPASMFVFTPPAKVHE